jgi:hypothetical protein
MLIIPSSFKSPHGEYSPSGAGGKPDIDTFTKNNELTISEKSTTDNFLIFYVHLLTTLSNNEVLESAIKEVIEEDSINACMNARA